MTTICIHVATINNTCANPVCTQICMQSCNLSRNSKPAHMMQSFRLTMRRPCSSKTEPETRPKQNSRPAIIQPEGLQLKNGAQNAPGTKFGPQECSPEGCKNRYAMCKPVKVAPDLEVPIVAPATTPRPRVA